ncbi:MAG TPA: alkaline phosphatase family protein, partial [Candidatus Nanopelagicales bacterium]|nr:alkaline phosphatase family protein [Candidatus Nanopelagicales bacterium]
AGQSFVGYSEGLPRTGWTGCRRGDYVRKHAPWVNFTDLPARTSRPLTAFPRDLSALPNVSFVIPDLRHDMHDGSIRSADRWLRRNVKRYADWAVDNDSLLIVTFDEDDRSQHNRIPTIAYGAAVRTGTLGRRIDHCSVLRTLESLYRLRPLGCAATTAPVRSLWRR